MGHVHGSTSSEGRCGSGGIIDQQPKRDDKSVSFMRNASTRHYANAAVKQAIEDHTRRNKDRACRELETVTISDIAAV
jgi:hypothetical protein